MLHFGCTFYAERTERCLLLCPKIKIQYKFLYSLLMKHTRWEKKGARDGWGCESGEQNRSPQRGCKGMKDRRVIQRGFGWGVQSNPPWSLNKSRAKLNIRAKGWADSSPKAGWPPLSRWGRSPRCQGEGQVPAFGRSRSSSLSLNSEIRVTTQATNGLPQWKWQWVPTCQEAEQLLVFLQCSQPTGHLQNC